MKYLILTAALLAATPALADAPGLTPDEAKAALGFLGATQLQGAQAPAFMQLVAKLQGIANPPPAPPASTK